MSAVEKSRRDHPVLQLALYFGGLIAVYAIGVVAFLPPSGGDPNEALFLVVMFAPTVGALLARIVAGGRIQWGRPNRWILAGLLPAAVALIAYLLGAGAGWYDERPGVLITALTSAPIAIASASLSAVGEEIGWRGFLWPFLRERRGFWFSSLVLFAIWWGYHVPLIIVGWYGDVAHLPAFTVAVFGITLFLGVITDRARGIWPSVMAHGAWNGLVATSFAVTEGGDKVAAFVGSDQLLGEFGWLAAASALLLGVVSAVWHVRAQRRAV